MQFMRCSSYSLKIYKYVQNHLIFKNLTKTRFEKISFLLTKYLIMGRKRPHFDLSTFETVLTQHVVPVPTD